MESTSSAETNRDQALLELIALHAAASRQIANLSAQQSDFYPKLLQALNHIQSGQLQILGALFRLESKAGTVRPDGVPVLAAVPDPVSAPIVVAPPRLVSEKVAVLVLAFLFLAIGVYLSAQGCQP